MNRTCIFVACAALYLGAFATTAAAERKENRQERGSLQHLDLTDDQKEQLQALREQYRGALRALRDTMAVLRERRREAFREAVLNVFTDEQRARLGPFDLQRELDAVLYDERIDAVREYMENILAAMGRLWDDMNDPEFTGRALSRLNLTDEQKKKIEELAEAQREVRHRWRRRLHNALEAILTDQQRGQLERLKSRTGTEEE